MPFKKEIIVTLRSFSGKKFNLYLPPLGVQLLMNSTGNRNRNAPFVFINLSKNRTSLRANGQELKRAEVELVVLAV